MANPETSPQLGFDEFQKTKKEPPKYTPMNPDTKLGDQKPKEFDPFGRKTGKPDARYN